MSQSFISKFITSPFDGLQKHAEKVKECARIFQKSIECILEDRFEDFEQLRKDVDKLESEADAIKRSIREQPLKGSLVAVNRFELFRYLREQDRVLDAIEESIDWLSFKARAGIPEMLEKDFMLLLEAVMKPIEILSKMLTEACEYFLKPSEEQRIRVKDIIRTLRQYENDSDKIEYAIKDKIFNALDDPVAVFHMTRLTENIGSIADYAENAGDMMRAIIAKKKYETI
jgi:predicted phosphate transport protein (TIGR00153 family)